MTSDSRRHLNLTAGAWRQLRRTWRLPVTPLLLWQCSATGNVLSAINRVQDAAVGRRAAACSLADSIFIVGYWRSGTTLLHELLCSDRRYTFPTTYACMNPHHFVLTQANALANGTPGTKRPMDDVVVHADSPQEDEFALLGLGARSPYEAFLVPSRLAEAMALADPCNLSESERRAWKVAFLGFLRGVSLVGDERPVIAKSPTHSYRIATISHLVPDARFILVVRDPLTVFESAARMWHRMAGLYSLGPIPSMDDIRGTILSERPRFEAKLAKGRATIAPGRFAEVRYEELQADPVGTIGSLYDHLGLGEFGAVRDAIAARAQGHGDYAAKSELPPEPWRKQVEVGWHDIRELYGYALS
jgi:omega-hydroxy-beta-dihydromenaquinone-9 sulfotransferase